MPTKKYDKNQIDHMIADMPENELSDLADVLEYADDEVKTEKHMFTTGINCTREFAKEEFALTKSQFGKQGGIVAIHGYQSFEEEHITESVFPGKECAGCISNICRRIFVQTVE